MKYQSTDSQPSLRKAVVTSGVVSKCSPVYVGSRSRLRVDIHSTRRDLAPGRSASYYLGGWRMIHSSLVTHMDTELIVRVNRVRQMSTVDYPPLGGQMTRTTLMATMHRPWWRVLGLLGTMMWSYSPVFCSSDSA